MDAPNDATVLFSNYVHASLPPVDTTVDLPRSARVRSRKTKNDKKKLPQRGLGVAQLEKLRLIEEQSKQEVAAHLAILQSQASLYQNHRPISFRPTLDSNISGSSASRKEVGLFLPDHQSHNSFQLRSSKKEVDGFGLLTQSMPYSLLIQSPDRLHVQDGVVKGLSIQKSINQGEDYSSSAVQPLKLWSRCTSLPLACYNSRSSTCSRLHFRSSDPDMGSEEQDYVDCANHKVLANESEYVSNHTDCPDPPPNERHSRYPGCHHLQSTCIQVPMVCLPPTSKRSMKELSSFQTYLNEHAACTPTEEIIHFKRRACAIVQDSTNMPSTNSVQKLKSPYKNSSNQELCNASLLRNPIMSRINQLHISKGNASQVSDVGLVRAWNDLSTYAVSHCETETPSQQRRSTCFPDRCKRLKDLREPEALNVRDFLKLGLSRDPGTGLDKQEDGFLTLSTPCTHQPGTCDVTMQDTPTADFCVAHALAETETENANLHAKTSSSWIAHLTSSKLPAAADRKSVTMNSRDDQAQAVDLTLRL